MQDIFFEWLLANKIEILGAILGILYIIFSIKQNVLTWPTGLLTSALYVIVFFQSKFYADMGLQVYYVVISVYGWYYWLKGEKNKDENRVLVKSVSSKLRIKLTMSTVIIYFTILFILIQFTDSDVPFMDSMTTALSIVATWMLARKYIEHWLIWIFVDLFSSGLYVYKNLWPTAVLFIIYTTMAVFGYYQWKEDIKLQKIEQLA